MKRVLSYCKAVCLLLLLMLGLVYLIATPLSFWKVLGVSVQIDAWPNDTTQINQHLAFHVGQGRAHFISYYDRMEGKFGTSNPEIAFDVGFFAPWQESSIWDMLTRFPWFDANDYFAGSPNLDNPLSVAAYRPELVVPSPLVGLILIAPGALWLLAIYKRSRHLRLQTNLCLHCGYNLTGVESDMCPECGAARPMATVSSSA
ncbi:MAG: hypothetical protein AAF911_14160 [Planctomycetota bacterium]